MRVFYGSSEAQGKTHKSILTLGVFDGVHTGHQHILQKLLARSKKMKGTSVVYTFDPHPVRLLAPAACPPLLQTPSQKMQTLKELGLQVCIIEPFTLALAGFSPEKFFEKIILERIQAQEIFVGYDFTFGHDRRGTTETLEFLGQKYKIPVHVIQAYFHKSLLVSSSQIRKFVADGDVYQAKELIGRPYMIEGDVIRGRGVGKNIGFHTANLKTDNEILPRDGVYLSQTWATGKAWPSLTNIGRNPTFGGSQLSVETHILRFQKNIVGKRIKIAFLKRLRDEIAFDSPAKLTAQIRKDIEKALSFFKRKPT